MNNILFVHGAWGGAWEFAEIVEDLNAQGYQATAIDLPGHGTLAKPLSEVTLAAYVDRVVEWIVAADGPVTLVGHSLAGMVISMAAERIPKLIDRLTYVAAMLPVDGDSGLTIMQDGESPVLPRLVFADDKSFVMMAEDDIRAFLLHDLIEGEVLAEHVRRLSVKQATEPFLATANVSTGGLGSVPKSYIRCDLDRVLPGALQDKMMAKWDIDRVVRLASGHFPLMSVPDELTSAIVELSDSPASRMDDQERGQNPATFLTRKKRNS